ncbi:MAG: Hsp20/alpha crystallin family protein [Chitinophagaceae bacterium]
MTHTKNFPAVFNLMDRFFQDDFMNTPNFRPAVNIRETEQAFELDLIAPGLSKQDFQVQLDQHLLTIAYEKKQENEEKKDHFIRREYSSRSFKRTFTLNEKIDTENIQAAYENGVLTITLPKTVQKEKLVKTLSIQ